MDTTTHEIEQARLVWPPDVAANASRIDLFAAWGRAMQRREYEAARAILGRLRAAGGRG